jgi:hypothetical protein
MIMLENWSGEGFTSPTAESGRAQSGEAKMLEFIGKLLLIPVIGLTLLFLIPVLFLGFSNVAIRLGRLLRARTEPARAVERAPGPAPEIARIPAPERV